MARLLIASKVDIYFTTAQEILMKRILLIVICCFVISCASNPGIINISPDTYMISRIDKAGIFGNAATMKAEVFQDANNFAKKLGKAAIPISINEIPAAPGRFASIEYQFRVVAEDDPEYSRVSLKPRADYVTESKNTIDLNINQSQESFEKNNKDIYKELIRLDDLLKKEIITEEEFKILKAKLLKQ